MEIVYKKVIDLIPYINNPRTHNEEQLKQIVASINEFGFTNPLLIDEKDNIIAGHGRLLASKKLNMEEVPCIVLSGLTEAQKKAYIIADNKLALNAGWDEELLKLELENLKELDFNYELTGLSIDELDYLFKEKDPYDIPKEEKGSLEEQFIVPPFSVLDTRQGYWQNRKSKWLELTGNLSETRDGKFGTISSGNTNMMNKINGGTSNFDPVLAEIIYKWFCIPKGKIIDPFGGEQTKGVVAGELGFTYKAVEFRQDQVDLNKEKIKQYKGVSYICGDSNNIDKLIDDNEFDLCFTSPPYYDLEVYSKEDMSALGTYEEFMKQYANIFKKCYGKMNNHSFLVIKVAEIRDKKTGQNRCFVADNIKCMENIGFKFYNDIVLINFAGTAPLRANNQMKTRKVVKVHQNVLVFYKGNLKEIQDYYPNIDFSEELLNEGA